MQSRQTSMHVTNRQGVQLADYAREHGVTREDFTKFLTDKEAVKNFLNGLKTDPEWFTKLQAEAVKIGGRVHKLDVPVNYTRSHNDAALAGGPQTDSTYNVLKVGGLYTSRENKTVTETIVLFNWPKGGGSYDKAVAFGLANGLDKTVPHEAFAVGEHFPKLNYDLGPNPMYVVETTGCSFDGELQACGVWWDDARRKSGLNWQSVFGRGRDWFAFRKK